MEIKIMKIYMCLAVICILLNPCVVGGVAVCDRCDAGSSGQKKLQQYCIVDLSKGSDAVTYPVTWSSSEPQSGWGDEYKTTKLVLRRVDPGSFIMGEDRTNESCRVMLTKPYYMGVFEVTQRQWELVMGMRPSDSSDGYEKLPVESVSYVMIRGGDSGLKWPDIRQVDAESFLGRLRKKTGLSFDLPTEAQWEYAGSAGATDDAANGEVSREYCMWCESNSEDRIHEVGLKTPNQWGLFDMTGNVSEWCLDAYSPMMYTGEDPVGGYYGGRRRAARGGSFRMDWKNCSPHVRFFQVPTCVYDYIGFRISLPMAK